MKATFNSGIIRGVLSVLPSTEMKFDDEVNNYNFPHHQTMKLKKIMGYNKHCIVKKTTSTSDLCIAGLDYLFEHKLIDKTSIGAIIVTTSTPDYLLPSVSSLLHGHYQFDEDVMCMDINQGCCGFIIGLYQAFMMLPHLDGKEILLITADTFSKWVSRADRNSYPLIGDAAGITVVAPKENNIKVIIKNKGSSYDALLIPAGGSRLKCSQETAELKDMDCDGNLRALDNLAMKGSDVFNFVMTSVPPLIDELMNYSNMTRDEIDYYFFHQPNKFMLKKLAKKIQVSSDKLPMNIVENFGNSSGATIPVNMTYNINDKMLTNNFKVCLSAFGSGLTWGGVAMNVGDMDFCEMYSFKEL